MDALSPWANVERRRKRHELESSDWSAARSASRLGSSAIRRHQATLERVSPKVDALLKPLVLQNG